MIPIAQSIWTPEQGGGPAYFLYDLLTGAANVHLDVHTPDIGGAWSEPQSIGANIVLNGSGACGPNSGFYALDVNAASPPGADYTASCRVNADVGYSNNQYICLRTNGGASTFYGIGIDRTALTLQLVYSSGLASLTVLDSMLYTPVVAGGGPGDVIAISAVGTALTGLLNGSPVLSATHGTITAAGKVGVYADRTVGQPVYFSEIAGY